ncbi:MAG: phosphatase PAP2 family protein [Candidatus Dormibacteraeota bacterium]|uniref:Phosphatase PAP2 family protein n=1 Tax=Candidatus Dormiibacter inghamiae TaxID=3127013 RepID=A0A934KKJ7_9BACT|nr:phosphatase PAP2 family protein [Candidatus Dormibacteraeota bacterium]MBJ7607227.1 phosphatase PAP2 family protein [Candidatus Dormibacteraeota bacterium]
MAASGARETNPAVRGHSPTVWLVAAAALLALLALDVWASRALSLSVLDLPLERLVQATTWGPLSLVMDLTNWSGGWPQTLLGIAATLSMLVWRWSAGLRLALAAVASLWTTVLKIALHRPRPAGELVHVSQINVGFSFPSGHAVFFTWLAVMLAAALVAGRGRSTRGLIWSAAVAVLLLAALGRVWAGPHWPTDVLGGILLGLGWCCLVQALPLPAFLLRIRTG